MKEEKGYPLYYIHSNNFGDAINPYLYRAITRSDCDDIIVPGKPKILACGSVAHVAQPGDIIWGTGCLPDLPLNSDVTTRIMALRGPLSAEMFYEHGHEDITEIYGDPALLLPRHFEGSSSKRIDIGIIPHYVDENLSHKKELMFDNIVHINIMNPNQLYFIQAVTGCGWVISSALHGIVCAEAYGIPAVWVEFSTDVAGKGFKFRDYYLGTNRIPPKPLDWRVNINLGDAIDIVKDWQPPDIDLDLLEMVCPFKEAEK